MDPASLPWPQVGVGSGWALAAFAVWLIMTGRLVPKTTLDRAQHDGNEWRTESRIKDQQLLERDIQLRHMEELGRNFEQLMHALQERAKDKP